MPISVTNGGKGSDFGAFSLCVVAITNNLAPRYECVIFTMYVGYDSCDWSLEHFVKISIKNSQVLGSYHGGSM